MRRVRARHGRLLLFVANRVAVGILTLLLVSVVVFAATQALPGDAAKAILGQNATDDSLRALRDQLNLDRPLTEQYLSWLRGILEGDLGTSLTARAPVHDVLGDRLANSAVLIGIAALIAFPLSIAIGAIGAYKRDRPIDHVSALVLLVLAALPEFVVGLGLVLLFSTAVFNVLPAVSLLRPGDPLWDHGMELILPVATLVIWELPYISRVVRASVIEILESDYIEMARLKGVPEHRVLTHHALPNAIIPTIHVVAMQLAVMFGGIVVVEFIFGFPGIGQALVAAVENRDLPVVQAITLLIAGAYVVLNLVADVITILMSPRLRTAMQ